MGDGVQVGKGAKSGETDEKTLLEHFLRESSAFYAWFKFFSFIFTLDDVVNAAITSLLTLSRTNKRPSFGSIFLLNNISYLRTSLIVSPRIDISALLSKPTQDILNSNFRIAKAGYFDSNFTQMMQALVDDGQKSNAAVKEKFTRFFDLLEENAERHKLARVLQEDAENREAICEEAVKMVVPSLLRFTQKSTGKGFSKSKLLMLIYHSFADAIAFHQTRRNVCPPIATPPYFH